MANELENASSGHKLGQLVGDWFQDYFVLPMLKGIADKLGLYLDHRLRVRPARPSGICWKDEDGNEVDYDFVMELGGSDDEIGVPVAFLECFWRRGARHSKDKARDDSGKLMPMRETYPTSRFLGIIASGEFTGPAREMISSRKIDLFYLPKQKVIDSFMKLDMAMDYDDKSSEGVKAQIARDFERGLSKEVKKSAASNLLTLMTKTVVDGYLSRVRASLSALPQEIRISGERRSIPKVFEDVQSATAFLQGTSIGFKYPDAEDRYCYEVTYSDNFEFSRRNLTLATVRELHKQISLLDAHMRGLSEIST
jgi:hypothetical protein